MTGASSSYYQSGDAAGSALWLDRTVESGAGLVRLGVSWAGRRAATERPPDPANPGSTSYDFSLIDSVVRDAEARGLAVLLTISARPALGGGTGAAGQRTTGHLEAESLRPCRLQPGGRRPLLGRLRSRHGAAAPRRGGDPDLGRAQPGLLAVARI